MTTKITILGWGSLLWDGGTAFDSRHEPWQLDGPVLRLEFSRISDSRLGALTLVIDSKHGSQTAVAWCLSTRSNPDDAIADLRCREGTTIENIGSIFLARRRNCSHDKTAGKTIVAWAKTKSIDVVVWSDLQSNFEKKRKKLFSTKHAIEYLKGLSPEAKSRAAEYVWRAPNFVQTELRTTLQQEPWFLSPIVNKTKEPT